jgi:hypothetical protein
MMETGTSAEARILEILRGVRGVNAVGRLNGEQLRSVAELEARHEATTVIPLHNVGVRLLARRDACYVLLKDGSFRPPNVPTVYLVEEGAREGSPHAICIDGAWYTVVGEEVFDASARYAEPAIPLDTSFVIYPDRRSSSQVPCTFILPPIVFPELEGQAIDLGISGIISISPSPAADSYLRTAFGFPPTNALATLLIGCNLPARA